MKIGRPRAWSAHIPAHIDQAKLPDGVYFDHRWGATWYLLSAVDGKRKRKNIARAKVTLAELHAIVEHARGDDTRGTLDWLCGQFEASTRFKVLAEGTRVDYRRCRAVLGEEQTTLNIAFGTLKIAGLTRPVFQRLIDRIARAHPTKANHVLRYLRRVYRWGANRGAAPAVNPLDGIEAATERKQRQLPPPTVMVAVIQYAATCGQVTTRRKGSQPPYLWAVAEIAYLCRLRGIEVVTLTDANATDEGVLTNRRKGSRDNVVTWTPRLRAAWGNLVERRDALWKARNAAVPMRAEDRPLVVAEDGAALRRAVLKTAWQRLMVAAIENKVIAPEQRFGMHAFKRRGITDTKGNRHEKQQASGHKNEAMLDVYDFSVPVVPAAGE